jgi:hypothetical protein
MAPYLRSPPYGGRASRVQHAVKGPARRSLMCLQYV